VGGRVAGGALRVGRDVIALQLGLARVEIRAVVRARVALPRPRVDRRMPAYLAASLVAQIALLIAAVVLAPFHDPPPRVIARPVHVLHPAPAKLPAPKPQLQVAKQQPPRIALP